MQDVRTNAAKIRRIYVCYMHEWWWHGAGRICAALRNCEGQWRVPAWLCFLIEARSISE
jgi:hypothetical protein